MQYIPLIPLSDLPENTHKSVRQGDKTIALFHYDGIISALDHACIHKGGDLGEGFIQTLDDRERYVACPWHGWQYNLKTGKAHF